MFSALSWIFIVRKMTEYDIQIFLARNQTSVVCQAHYSPDIRRYRQKSLNQVPLFSYIENPKRVLNTTSLKCCLPSTDAIDRQEKIHACVGWFKVASCKRASLKSTRFSQKNRIGYFSNRVVYYSLLRQGRNAG